MPAAQTPVRALDVPLVEGCRVLEDSPLGHLDGGEERVRELIAAASDRSDMSDELARHDEIWETRYHFARERAHVLRALDLPADGRVLEVGAGCGAVTRFLGEACATVDAVEPTAERARIARLRTADLDSVEVFVGSLEAIPRKPAYDVIAIIGVLEYVEGPDPWAERVRFLREAAARLRPGGAVVCAIENRFGVQYLAGAPEDHLGEAFAGIEGYPRPGIARTFSRADLERMFAEAGLAPAVRHVFPDYKFARLVYDDALLDTPARSLTWRAPSFPSWASPRPRPRLASEGHLWRGLAQAGLAGQHANSFLVVGATDPERPLWPHGLLAAFFSTHRRAAYVTETRVEAGPVLRRRVLQPHRSVPDTGLVHRVEAAPWREGPALLELLEGEDRAAWLQRWRAVVESAPRTADGTLDVDLVPHNLVLDGDELVTVDSEWFRADYGARDVLGRGLLHLGVTLADRVAPERWAGAETVRDAVRTLMEEAGVPELHAELDAIVRRESELIAAMSGMAVERQVANFESGLHRRLEDTALGLREMDLHARAEQGRLDALGEIDRVWNERTDLLNAERETAAARIAELEARERELHARLAELTESNRQGWAAYETVVNSRSWKLTGPLRRLLP